MGECCEPKSIHAPTPRQDDEDREPDSKASTVSHEASHALGPQWCAPGPGLSSNSGQKGAARWHCQVAGRHPEIYRHMLCSRSDEIATAWMRRPSFRQLDSAPRTPRFLGLRGSAARLAFPEATWEQRPGPTLPRRFTHLGRFFAPYGLAGVGIIMQFQVVGVSGWLSAIESVLGLLYLAMAATTAKRALQRSLFDKAE